MPNLRDLREQHPRFYYRDYSWELEPEGLKLSFHFELEPGIHFRPTMTILGVSQDVMARLNPKEIDLAAFNIGMAELFSYWKTAASPEIIIEAAPLSSEQLAWWHDLLIQGMGEYFFVNRIDFTDPGFVKFVSASTKDPAGQPQNSQRSTPSQNVLIPLGGGKDSVTTLELYREIADEGRKLACFFVNPTQAARDIARESGVQAIEASRTLDLKMLELNSQGYLNGHVPISALFAFTSVLAARLFGFGFIAISNERSSNEGNVWFHDREINHQYSKTFEFEQKFQQYIRDYYPPDSPLYFSYLRPIYELQIAGIFADYKSYHHDFRSCNAGQKTNSWCGQCPKCLFAYTILYPFLETKHLDGLFGKNLFSDENLLPLALELAGAGEQKPLECVGTHEETIAAFHLSWKKHQADPSTQPVLLKLVYETVLANEAGLDARAAAILSAWNDQHTIPEKTWEEKLREKIAGLDQKIINGGI